jgi:hypothetical protein
MPRVEARLGVYVFRVRARPLVGTADLPPLPPGWTVRQLTHSELRAVAADPSLEISDDFVASTVARSSTATVVFDGQRIVSYAFAIVGSAPAGDGVWVSCSPPYRYSFKSFTRPEYRGRRLSAYTSLGSDAVFLRRGCTHAISYTATHNFASIRTEASKGNVPIGFAGYIVFGERRFTFRSPGCRRAGFAFVHPAHTALANQAWHRP